MKKLIALLTIMVASPVWSFNLWHDIQQETRWTLGSSAAAGTAIALKDSDALHLKAGDPTVSFLASIAEYRFLSAWWGGNEIHQDNGASKLIDTAKIGFNVAYAFRGFVNQPPEVIKRIVIGPSVSMNLLSTPHVMVPFFDVNYQFGGLPAAPAPASSLPPTATSRLNLVPLAMDEITAQKG